MRVLGIDPSQSATGVFSTFTGRGERVQVGAAEGIARVDIIWRRVEGIIQAERPHAIVIEGYSFGSKFSREMAGEVGGVVRIAALRSGARWFLVPPRRLKEFWTGDGDATKAMMIAAAARLGFVTRDDNQADAYLLAKLGEILLTPPGQWEGLSSDQIKMLRGILSNPHGTQKQHKKKGRAA